MFKLAQAKTRTSVAQQFQRRLVQPQSTVTDVTARGIRAPHITLNADKPDRRRKHLYDVHGEIVGRLGIVRLNKEHRFNTLSPSFAHEVSRGIGSMYEDRLTRAIYVAPAKGEQWSNGTDFRTMHTMKQEGNYQRLADYLQQLYQLQTQVAKTNKPIVAAAPGHAFNSGATLLASCGFPMMTIDSKMAFNECTFGFVPHSGATYYLSRLPSEFGTFLALTGMPIHGTDAAKLDLVDGLLQRTQWVEEDAADVIYSLGYAPEDLWDYTVTNEDRLKGPLVRDSMRSSSIRARNLHNNDLDMKAKDRANLQSYNDITRRPRGFEDVTERIPSSTAFADMHYDQLLRRESLKHETEGTPYLEQGQQLQPSNDFIYQHSFQTINDYLKSHLGHKYEADKTVAFQHKEMIARCFYPSSVEEIKHNLRQENHPFAQKCLEAMERNSDLSMALALKMLRRAISLDYTSCLKMEINVASKMIETKDFDAGVQQVLLSGKAKKGQKHPNAAKYHSDGKENLDAYFEGAAWAKDIKIGAVAHSLLPTRHYYERFGDQVRLWINEQSTHQDELRIAFDNEAKEALHEQGIDVRDRGLTMQSAREHLAAKLAQEHRNKVEMERMEQIMCDKKLREQYFEQVNAEVKKLRDMDKAKFQQTVDDGISKVFENAYIGRLQNMYEKSKDAQSLERRRMLIRMKRFLFKTKCLSRGAESYEKELERLEQFDYKLPHCSETWTKSWRDTHHPLIEKSPLFQLSKAIGRANISPVELTQEYLTNPAAREQLSMLTIDKNELLKLQEDIYANPQKYENMFTKQEAPDIGSYMHLWHRREDPRLSDSVYWFSMLNDGTDAVQNWPYYREYCTYKDWFDQVEDRALSTLKMAVAQLLSEFDQKTNKVYQEDSLTKRGQMEKLLSLIQGYEENQSEGKNASKTKKERKITSSKRDVDFISQLLDETVSEDIHLNGLFDSEQATKHPMIGELQEKARNQLLKMLEIVLLDKNVEVSDPEEKLLLKQRLAAVMTPEGMSRDEVTHQQLKLIDAYLLNESGKATLKSAIDVIKPMYLQFVDSLLKEAGQTVCEQFSCDKNNSQVLPFYYLRKMYPGVDRSPALDKLRNYSRKEHNHEIYWQGEPTARPTFRRSQLLASFGPSYEGVDYLTNEPIEAQKARVAAQVQLQKKMIDNWNKEVEAMEEEYRQEVLENRTKDPENINPLAEYRDFWNEKELNELAAVDNMMNSAIQWIDEHRYEIENHFSVFEWLRIYGDAILDQDLDMNYICDLFKHREGANYNGPEQRSDEDWNSLAHLAKYLADYKETAQSYSPGILASMPDFMANQKSLTDSVSHSSLWQLALQKRKELLQQNKANKRVDRDQIIRNELADFNKVHELSQKRDKISANLERVAQTQPAQVQDLINEMLNSSSNYIDFEKLQDKLMEGEDLVQNLSSCIDTERLIADVKSSQGPRRIQERFLQTSIDVQAIMDAREEAERDSSLTEIERAQIMGLIDYVNESMLYVSNSRRQAITMGQFLSEHHSSSTAAINNYSTNLLQQKLAKSLGQTQTQGDVIDWEVDGVRTSPIDHSSDSDSASFLTSVAKRQEQASEVDEKVTLIDQDTGISESRSLRDHAQIQVLRDAKRLTKIPEDMQQYKNYYENSLIVAMMKPNSDVNAEESQQSIIDEYMTLRFKTCMLNSDFAEQVRSSDNGHIFLKVLRERVVDELGLTREPELEDMQFAQQLMRSKEYIKYDVESLYNMQDVNNTNAIGYDRLGSRSGSDDKAQSTYESAHESVFDKLLADYYLAQRGEYAESNKLMRQLTDVFEKKQRKKDSRPDNITSDNLVTYKRMQDLHKVDKQTIPATAGRTIFELDVLTHQAMQKGKSGLSDDLRQLSITDTEHPDHWTTQVPEYFDTMDVRKKPEKYVADKLQQVIEEAFETRKKLERNMSRRELVAFDKVLAKYLEPENLLKRLDAAIEEDYSAVFQGRQVAEHARQTMSSNEEQALKEPNKQREYNKKIKDEDALYKQMAYGAIVEMKYKQQMENPDNETFMDKEYQLSPYTFERWYLNQLEIDATKEPRPIDSADYQPKKKIEYEQGAEPVYLDQRAREKQFFDDHSLFLENKKEQQDRTKLFYILEQFFEHSREQPDKMSEAQDHMREYFSDPQHTFFFDKNKIQ